MRRVAGAVLVLLFVPALSAVLWVSPATASPLAAPPTDAPQHVQLTVDSSSWTWRQTVSGVEPSNVPTGDLPVQFDGRPSAPPAKATYLHLALADLPAGTVARTLTLALPLDPAVSQDATSAPLVACRLTAAFVSGAGVDPATAPAEDCTGSAHGVLDASKKSVSFGLTALADGWLSGANYGVVVRPDPAAAFPAVLPFQLSFLGPTAIHADLLAVLPTGAAPLTETPAPSPQPEQSAGPVAVAPLPLIGSVPQPLAPQPQLPPPPQLTPSGSSTTAVASPQAVTTVLSAGRASAAGFALAAALGAGVLALMGWSMGSACDPAALARRERSRLDRLQGVRALPAQPRQIRHGRRPAASAASTVR